MLVLCGSGYSNRQILGHFALLVNSDQAGFFQGVGKLLQCLILVQFGAVSKTPGPRINTGNRISRCLLTPIILWLLIVVTAGVV